MALRIAQVSYVIQVFLSAESLQGGPPDVGNAEQYNPSAGHIWVSTEVGSALLGSGDAVVVKDDSAIYTDTEGGYVPILTGVPDGKVVTAAWWYPADRVGDVSSMHTTTLHLVNGGVTLQLKGWPGREGRVRISVFSAFDE